MLYEATGDLLDGLLPGYWRGIAFHVPDASTAAGRRVAEQLFPGVDLPAYDDFGVAPAIIAIEALIVGDDYIAKGRALEAAMETPGQSTLVHPWLGPMTVILEEPGQVFYSTREMRVTRWSVTFKRIPAGAGFGLGLPSSLTMLTAAIGAVISTASALSFASSRLTLSATRQKSITRTHRVLNTRVAALVPAASARRTVTAIKASIPTIAPSNVQTFDAIVRAVAGHLSTRSVTPAVAPAAEATATRAATPAALVRLGLALSAGLSADITPAPATADCALIAATAAHMLSAVAEQSIYATYASRNDALSFRSQAGDIIDLAITGLEALGATLVAGEAGDLRRALSDLKAAIGADINERLGRLPAVLVFDTGRPVDAFLLAHHVFGDRPEAVEPAYRDIVARNRPRHPAVIEGAIEVLK